MSERAWPYNSERLHIVMGISGDAQESGFMNATLQGTGNDPNLEFSVAVHVEIPSVIVTEDVLAAYLGAKFGDLLDRPEGQGLHVEIQLGPAGDGEEPTQGHQVSSLLGPGTSNSPTGC